MSDPADPSAATVRNRYLAITLTRIAGAGGAMVGLVLIGRADATFPKVLGTAIVLSSMLLIALVPRALARRWRTPPTS